MELTSAQKDYLLNKLDSLIQDVEYLMDQYEFKISDRSCKGGEEGSCAGCYLADALLALEETANAIAYHVEEG